MTPHTICSLLFCIIWIFPVRIYWHLCNKCTYLLHLKSKFFSKLLLSVYSMADIEEATESSPSQCLWSAIQSWHTVYAQSLRCVRLFETPQTVAHQAPLLDSPGKNTGVGFQFLLQGIFLTQGLNPGLPHCRQILYHLKSPGKSMP